jgi:CheY-like chemotaxis protein
MEILIADDDSASRVYLELVLRALSHTPATAENGAEALELLGYFSFDAVLLDIEMPVLGGVETLQRIRANPALRDLPVFAITAHTDGDEVEAIAKAGFTGYLSKPYSPGDLERLLAGDGGRNGLTAGRAAPILDAEVFQEYEGLLRDAGMSPEAAVRRTLDAVSNWLGSGPACSGGSREEAHSLAGSCAVIGASALRGALKELERLAAAELSADWPEAIGRAEAVLWETREAYGIPLNGFGRSACS